MITIPPALAQRRELGPEWAAWLDRLPRLAADVCADWNLTPSGDPLHGFCALILPVTGADGVPMMMKLTIDEGDNAGEAEALKAWRGLGAARLEAADPHRGALLLERLGPDDLNGIDALRAAEIVGRLMVRLHVPPTPTIPRLAPFVTRWLDDLHALGRQVPAPPRFVQQALGAGRALASDRQMTRAIVHGDLHYDNVLAGRREPWQVIDPKGFAGDPAYELAPMLWNRWDELVASGDVGSALRERFYALVDASGLDERRCRDWVVVRSMIGVGWEVRDARAADRDLSPEQRDWVTRCITTAKAMQAVGS